MIPTGELNVVSTLNREVFQSMWNGELVRAISQRVKPVKLLATETREDLLKELLSADVILAGPLDKELLAAAPGCQLIHTFTGGVESLLFPELRKSSVRVACMKGCYDITAAEHGLAMMLTITRRLYYDLGQRATRQFDDYQIEKQSELRGKTLGIVGLGGIGNSLATRAQCLGMKVVGMVRDSQKSYIGIDQVFRPGQLKALLQVSDFVAICVPLTAETRGMIKAEELREMKSEAYLIDVSGRVDLYHLPSLETALKDGWIAGAFMQFGIPPPENSPLGEFENFLYSYHRTTSRENYAYCIDRICENLARLIDGQPLLGEVDKLKGY